MCIRDRDGYLALKLRNQGYGKLYKVNNIKALAWTTDRRIQTDGGIWIATSQRLKKFFSRSKEISIRSDL